MRCGGMGERGNGGRPGTQTAFNAGGVNSNVDAGNLYWVWVAFILFAGATMPLAAAQNQPFCQISATHDGPKVIT